MILPLLIALAVGIPADMTPPVWKHLPAASQLAAAYPLMTEAPGDFEIDLRCRIMDAAGHVRCIAIGESPSEYGVGAKTAALFTRFAILDMRRMPRGARGRVVTGHCRITEG